MTAPPLLDRSGYDLEIADEFEGPELNDRLWIPSYLPHWSSGPASQARYAVRDGTLRLRIEANQAPWYPELDGWTRVSSLQTGVFAGPRGSPIGQHRFREGLLVREEVQNRRLYTPTYGLFELRARAIADPNNMVALWMIGYEERPERSAEICVFEIFGKDVGIGHAAIGMGVHPFGDPAIRDEFARERVPIDATEFHTYAALWTRSEVAFYVDDRLVKVVRQSPDYPMQFMLGVYEFSEGPDLRSPPERYPKEFVVDFFRAYRSHAVSRPSPPAQSLLPETKETGQ